MTRTTLRFLLFVLAVGSLTALGSRMVSASPFIGVSAGAQAFQGTIPRPPSDGDALESAPVNASDTDATTDATADTTSQSTATTDGAQSRSSETVRQRFPRRTAPSAQSANQRLQIGDVPVRRLIGDPHSATLYAVSVDGRLYRSEDGARSWSPVTATASMDMPRPTTFAMSPGDPMVLYAGNGVECSQGFGAAPFFKSEDGGASWTTVPTAAGLIPLLLHPSDADVVLAADCDLPFLTESGGDGWDGKPDQSPTRLWTQFHAKLAAAATTATDAAANLDYLYLAGEAEDGTGVVVYSGDGGDTWTRITPQANPAPRRIVALAADRHNAGRVWFVDEHGVWATDDFGAMWTLQTDGLEELWGQDGSGAEAVSSLVYVKGHGLYLGTDHGLFRLADDAEAWTPVSIGSAASSVVDALLSVDSMPDMLWVTTDRGVVSLSLR